MTEQEKRTQSKASSKKQPEINVQLLGNGNSSSISNWQVVDYDKEKLRKAPADIVEVNVRPLSIRKDSDEIEEDETMLTGDINRTLASPVGSP